LVAALLLQPVCLEEITVIAAYSRWEHDGADYRVFIQVKANWSDLMDGRREARIVGLGITAVYVCLLLAALGSA
jgi:hypothetical protein